MSKIVLVKGEGLGKDDCTQLGFDDKSAEDFINDGKPEFKELRKLLVEFMEVTGDTSITFNHEDYTITYTFIRE
jgi:hypothetical protein